ncbi:MAG TPA: sigma-70 family RNA polymerase sigma factor [Ktedonobacteraceae bacterium]|nr:sigma-70 family RNA polymerase sigma factor [Ktedonobacteraceae bacterium]
MQQPQPGTTPVPGVPDGVLVGQALTGDELAFATLMDRYQDPLLGYIRGMLKDSEQSSDVLQQVLLQLYISLPTLKTHTRLSGWLFRVAHNRCIDELRKRYRRNEVCFSALEWESTEEELSPVERIADSQPLPEEIAVQRDLHDTLRRAIDVLPPKFRRIVYLRCWRDLSFAEIARLLKMPETTVKTSFHRACPLLGAALAGSVQSASTSSCGIF